MADTGALGTTTAKLQEEGIRLALQELTQMFQDQVLQLLQEEQHVPTISKKAYKEGTFKHLKQHFHDPIHEGTTQTVAQVRSWSLHSANSFSIVISLNIHVAKAPNEHSPTASLFVFVWLTGSLLVVGLES